MTLYTEKQGRDVARIERTVILINVVTKYLTFQILQKHTMRTHF